MSRTTANWMRIYLDGYRMSGYTEKIGPLSEEFPELARDALSDAVGGSLPGRARLSPGTLNGLFDNTALGLHALASGGNSLRHLIVAIGENAEPVAGCRVFAGDYRQLSYQAVGDGIVAANASFAGWDVSAATRAYDKAFGVLLHADGAETTVNTSTGVDGGGATTYGGLLAYQVLAGDGTATLKIQDAAVNTNPSFSDLSGATTGLINCATPSAGLVALSNTATVRQYLRWQIVLGSASTVTFVLAFIRRYRS